MQTGISSNSYSKIPLRRCFISSSCHILDRVSTNCASEYILGMLLMTIKCIQFFTQFFTTYTHADVAGLAQLNGVLEPSKLLISI